MTYAQPLKWGARYKCASCDHEFTGYPGPDQNPGGEPKPTQCPECGHIYVEWLNYDEYKLK